ncbi:MAG TPA: hypothetical protein PKW76_15670 [bacterium]|nr:hypothetical protein [bacterium]HPM99561.1 hypothetical protein [bacterium]
MKLYADIRFGEGFFVQLKSIFFIGFAANDKRNQRSGDWVG